uniref:Uncharacterized protein n=1 Tax=Cacopsylla melanoneura TaxID=428564 RepID=A0A8D8XQ68_9HEMI
MDVRVLTFFVLFVTIINVISAQKKDKNARIKIENEEELERLNDQYPNMDLPQKEKLAIINKLIKASKLDMGSKKFNAKDWKQNKTNVEFVKNGNKTIVVDKETNKTIDEINNEDLEGHQEGQNWYWWG